MVQVKSVKDTLIEQVGEGDALIINQGILLHKIPGCFYQNPFQTLLFTIN